MPHRTLIYVHIPKTAGSTLKMIIERQFPPHKRFIVEGEHLAQRAAEFLELSDHARGSLRCVMGHIPFGIHQYIPTGPEYITMLRDPVEWAVSWYHFVRRMPFFRSMPEYRLFAPVFESDMSLVDFVEFLADIDMVNLQTRAIGGFVGVGQLLPPYSPLPGNALAIAKENLEKRFRIVGLVEHFDESLLLMKREFGWQSIHYARLNVGNDRPRTTPPDVVDRIYRRQPFDVELYHFARDLLSRRLEQQGADFARELTRFRAMNASYNLARRSYHALVPVSIRDAIRRKILSSATAA